VIHFFPDRALGTVRHSSRSRGPAAETRGAADESEDAGLVFVTTRSPGNIRPSGVTPRNPAPRRSGGRRNPRSARTGSSAGGSGRARNPSARQFLGGGGNRAHRSRASPRRTPLQRQLVRGAGFGETAAVNHPVGVDAATTLVRRRTANHTHAGGSAHVEDRRGSRPSLHGVSTRIREYEGHGSAERKRYGRGLAARASQPVGSSVLISHRRPAQRDPPCQSRRRTRTLRRSSGTSTSSPRRRDQSYSNALGVVRVAA